MKKNFLFVSFGLALVYSSSLQAMDGPQEEYLNHPQKKHPNQRELALPEGIGLLTPDLLWKHLSPFLRGKSANIIAHSCSSLYLKTCPSHTGIESTESTLLDDDFCKRHAQHLHNLTTLKIKANGPWPLTDGGVSRLTQLQKLEIFSNYETFTNGALYPLTRLQDLRLSGQGVTVDSVSYLTNLTSLRVGSSDGLCSGCAIGSKINSKELTSLAQLRHLRAPVNFSVDLENLMTLTNLERLDFKLASSSDANELKILTKLTYLAFNPADTNPNDLTSLTNLTCLHFTGQPWREDWSSLSSVKIVSLSTFSSISKVIMTPSQCENRVEKWNFNEDKFDFDWASHNPLSAVDSETEEL
jgi:hypothetical protein